MQTRTCFNGGELSAELAARADLDAYMRGCRKLENWELSQMGGVKRRRGMRSFADCETGALLIPFVYSYSGEGNRFLIVLEKNTLRVLDMEGAEVATFPTTLPPTDVRYLQINALMLLTTPDNPPMALEVSEELEWTLHEYEIKEPPWRFDNEKRDTRVVVTKGKNGFLVEFDEAEDEGETDVYQVGDELRVSFWTEQKEAKSEVKKLLDGVRVVEKLSACNKGDRVAIVGELTRSYWVCTKDWHDVYVEGLEAPEDYSDNFSNVYDVATFSDAKEVTSVHEVTGGNMDKGKKFVMLSGYWEYYTCIKDFTALDIVEGADSFADYPGHFVRGLAIGDALPCRGKWNFYCSGLWYGSYEVRKNYESDDLSGEWETCGVSFSRLGEGSNDQLTGDESDEECYLRLFITRSKYRNRGMDSGFPPEICGNRLIVPGYRHDMRLRFVGVDDYNGDNLFEYANKVKVDWEGRREAENWSWKAWSRRYGYPVVAAVCQQRLCFAGSYDQPQTVWMSRTDDINNFATGDSDDSAIVRTLYSSSQNPICWMKETRNQLIVGTAEAEWTIGSNNAAMTPSASPITRHSMTGSMDGEVVVQAAEKVLFVERGSGRVYEWGYSFDIDGYRARDLTVLAPHVLRDHGGAVQATLLRKPDTVAVYALADGQVALCTYNNFQEVNAWHRWTTDGKVKSVCAMPDGERSDRLFLVVERSGKERIEVVDEDSYYVDDGSRDYVSELVTNALNNPLEQLVKKQPKRPILVKFGEPCTRRYLQIAVEGTAYTEIAKEALVLEAGWNELLPENTWTFENAVGLRFTGREGCHILALQG